MSDQTQAAAATVVGTGTMGSALARALLAAGHTVTVWNRTQARAQPLADAGAHLAPDLAAAVQSSNLVITCVASPAVVDELVGEPSVLSALSGRTLVQLTTGTPSEIRRGAALVQENGVTYLGGAIMASPNRIGSDQAILLYGGDEVVFARHRAILDALGRSIFLGDDPAGPTAMDAALIGFFYGAMAGFLNGARLTRAEGGDMSTYLELATPFLRSFVAGAIDDAGQRIISRDYSDPQSSLATHLGGIDDLVVGSSREAGIDHAVMEAVRDEIAAGVRAGRGDQDIAALLDEAPVSQ